MKLERGIALLLAAVFLFGTLAVPAGAAAPAGTGSAGTDRGCRRK